MRRIGVDVGGTFTDLIYIDDEAGKVIVHKTPSTPADPRSAPSRASASCARWPASSPSQLDQVFHGTTVATNIVIEHNGAKVGMITTKGYRDILHIARHKKPMNFSLWQNLPWQALPDRAAALPAHGRRAHRQERRHPHPARRRRGARAGAPAQGRSRSRRSRSACCSRSSTPSTSSASRRSCARSSPRRSSRSRARSSRSTASTSASRPSA